MSDAHNKAAGKRRSPTACCRDLDSTPRTDAKVEEQWAKINLPDSPIPAEFARKLERELNVSRAVNLDDCHTDTLCRDAARSVLGDWVDGDNWGVPSIADIVDRLVNMVILSDNVEGLGPATGSAPPILVEVSHHPPNPTRRG